MKREITSRMEESLMPGGLCSGTLRHYKGKRDSTVKREPVFLQEFFPKVSWVVATSAVRVYLDLFFNANVTLFPRIAVSSH